MHNPLPENEEQRNRSVESLGQLDTPAEERFDRLTRLAKRAFDTPFCMMTLIHRDRQWFKSAQGHVIPETPRIESFCKQTIMDNKTLVVPDARTDSRFFDMPVVFDMGIRFYAGVPIHSTDRQRVGTLCILDTEKKSFEQEDRALLEDLALCVESELGREHWTRAEKELVSRVEELSKRVALDDVTRCWNETAIHNILAKALKNRVTLSSTRAPACLALQVDKVEELNQEFGPEVGDQLLRAVANRVRRMHAGMETPLALGRLRGPRFLVVFEDLDTATSEQLCEDIIDGVSRLPLKHQSGSTPVRVSGGLVLGTSMSSTKDDLINRAQGALEKAFASGPGTLRRSI